MPAVEPSHVSSPGSQGAGKETVMAEGSHAVVIMIFKYPTVVPSALYPARSRQKAFPFLVLFFSHTCLTPKLLLPLGASLARAASCPAAAASCAASSGRVR